MRNVTFRCYLRFSLTKRKGDVARCSVLDPSSRLMVFRPGIRHKAESRSLETSRSPLWQLGFPSHTRFTRLSRKAALGNSDPRSASFAPPPIPGSDFLPSTELSTANPKKIQTGERNNVPGTQDPCAGKPKEKVRCTDYPCDADKQKDLFPSRFTRRGVKRNGGSRTKTKAEVGLERDSRCMQNAGNGGLRTQVLQSKKGKRKEKCSKVLSLRDKRK